MAKPSKSGAFDIANPAMIVCKHCYFEMINLSICLCHPQQE
ncbi:msl7785 [Mesorhizobium japonicum MAFF 303099]|uniref:Msl7785 protein n=1 Tax=Mesorhizobium japonicum (strain LMG 29417 / CECT 9101 / MAFF 303099) TaxID=266835 RepID=Q984Z0_RHILO|nr:msl7785 [Mesorhizobium japonicum MAFF 303099]